MNTCDPGINPLCAENRPTEGEVLVFAAIAIAGLIMFGMLAQKSRR